MYLCCSFDIYLPVDETQPNCEVNMNSNPAETAERLALTVDGVPCGLIDITS